MNSKTVLISGASIAGPALAYWLSRYGCRVTVVERAAALRPGGQAVDFKGQTHRKVLERMGILDEVYRRQTGKTDWVFVDEQSRPLGAMPGEFVGGDVEILRGDLSEILYERTAAECEYLFGDSISALTETATGVAVEFEHAAPRTFDLVFGADGIHSRVRRLAFGPEDDYVQFLGYYYSVAGAPTFETGPASGGGQPLRARAEMYNVPGKAVVRGGSKADQFYIFAAPRLDYSRDDIEQQKRIVRETFAEVGWEVPSLLAMLDDLDGFYLDSISRVRMNAYTSGRVALLGDAAYGNTLGGFGTGLGIVGAYVLAHELVAAGGDHAVAFAGYDEIMHRYAKVARTGSAGPALAPKSRFRIRMRNWMFRNKTTMALMVKITDKFANDIALKDYPTPV